MKFDIYFEEEHFTINVNQEDIASGRPFFAQMDRDMDGGWRMGPEFVHKPDIMQRCQIVAERLMLALERQNEALARAMAAYIAWRHPGIREVRVNTDGEPLLTEIII